MERFQLIKGDFFYGKNDFAEV